METTPATATLWTIEDIAQYYGRSVRTARRLIREAGFPAPARGDRHRWVAAHVIAFAESGYVPHEDTASTTLLRSSGGSGRIQRLRRKAAA